MPLNASFLHGLFQHLVQYFNVLSVRAMDVSCGPEEAFDSSPFRSLFLKTSHEVSQPTNHSMSLLAPPIGMSLFGEIFAVAAVKINKLWLILDFSHTVGHVFSYKGVWHIFSTPFIYFETDNFIVSY